jgi:hypothetical protein
MERTFKRVTKEHLEEYLPQVIDKFGHVILHGDGNMYVNKDGVQKEHQRSYIAKTYAGTGNEAATYTVRFTSIEQLPKDLDTLEKMFLDSKAREKFDDGKIDMNDNFLSIGTTKKPESKRSAKEKA